jgi:hypothetical protein
MAGYKLYLPYECPWCKESEILERYLPRLDEEQKEYATVRVEKLKNRSGLSHPFLIGTESSAGEEKKTQGSIFGNLSPTAAFSAAVGACQELRQYMNLSLPIVGPSTRVNVTSRKIWKSISSFTNKISSLIIGKPLLFKRTSSQNSGSIIYVVDLKKVLHYYYDSVLLSAVLRTFSLRELQNRGQENAVIEALKFKHPSHVYPGTITELGWAAVNRKIPHHAALNLLRKDGTNDICISMLVKLLSLSTN